jgi:hypothetical protein
VSTRTTRLFLVVLAVLMLPPIAQAHAQTGGRIIFFEGFNGRDSAFNGHRVLSGDGRVVRDLPEIPVTQLGRFVLNRDGTRVAWGFRTEIYAANARFRQRVVLARLIKYHNDYYGLGSPAFSPSGDLIALSGNGPNFNPPSDYAEGVYVIPSTGGTPTLVPNSERLREPSWAPDGRRIVAVRPPTTQGGAYSLVVLDRVAGTATDVLSGPPEGLIQSPQWSPDGTRFAYQVSTGPMAGIWVASADGTGARLLVAGSTPRWSPDGQTLAFVVGVDATTAEIHAVRADGSGRQRMRASRHGVVVSLAGWVSGDLQPLKPALGKSMVAEVARGRVPVRRPGSRKFVELVGEATIPVGSIVDTRKGAVRITSASKRSGATQSAVFSDGVFKVLQKASSKPITELRLVGKLEGCRGARGAAAAAKRSGRRLWGVGKGRFRTRGRRSAATVSGTNWLVEDRCDGSTLTRVRAGVVKVRDFEHRRTVTLRAGGRYVAAP